jgi:hypothetical protein
VNTHRSVVRVLIGLGLVCAAVLALASSIVLHGVVLVAVGVVAVLAAWVAYGAARAYGRAAAVEAAWKVTAGTVSVIVLVTGIVVLAGGAVAVLVSGMAGVTAAAVWILRHRRSGSAGARAPGTAPATDDGDPEPLLAAVRLSGWQPPVGLLPTSVLGSEWLRTTSVLGRPVEPAARQEIVRRRQETLDELERRDPAGFARWLAAGAAADSDPADFVRGQRTTGSDAA